MEKNSKIYVPGHTGLVGSAVVRKLQSEGYTNVLTKSHSELNLVDGVEVEGFFKNEKPEYVILCAAKVGGILSNSTYPGTFIYNNIMIQTNVIHNAYKYGVKKLCFLGSSCIYPKNCQQPIKESYLLSSELEPTNDAYAIAKISGIKMCQAYNKEYGFDCISLMPCNLFGIGDCFDLKNSHVLPALISKFVTAKERGFESVTLWGTGAPMREFLFADDLADAILFLMNNYSGTEIINVGTGKDISILDLANKISNIIGYNGKIKFDISKPDGTMRKVLDVSKINKIGWHYKTSLDEGLNKTIEWFVKNKTKINNV